MIHVMEVTNCSFIIYSDDISVFINSQMYYVIYFYDT